MVILMNYDYNKIVNFLFGKEIKALNSVIEEVINSRYTLIDVNTKNKMFLLTVCLIIFRYILQKFFREFQLGINRCIFFRR